MTKCPYGPPAEGAGGPYACPLCGCPIRSGEPHAACLEGCPMQDRKDQNVRKKAMEYMARYGED